VDILPAVRRAAGRVARWIVLVAAALGVAGPGPAAAASHPSGPAFNIRDPCTYPSPSQVQQSFGAPVTTNHATGLAIACNFVVGAAAQPTGTLVVALIYPVFPPPGETAVDIIEVQRAIDGDNNVTIANAKLGKASYFNLDNSTLSVAVSKKFAVTLQWTPTGAPASGTQLTPPVQSKLTAVAKSIFPRTPKSRR
jgi:hypothetical protein